jgi:hypothetical protein
MPWKNGPPKVPCPTCGQPMYRRGAQCRACYRASQPKPTCSTCGADVSTKTATQCRACWMKEHQAKDSRPKCKRCGVTISWMSGTAASQRKSRAPSHCRPCFNAIRKENRIFVEYERMRAVKADGVIETHQQRAARHVGIQLRKILQPMPCAVCGYNRAPCDVHRLVPQRGYVMGNVVQVCPNCHREIHKKVILPPEPTILALPDSIKNARS